jgi:L-threonylcarbamoyladenylate synthase
MMPDPIGEAVEWVRGGGLLAYPTETVWGLGADARTAAPLEQLRRWKGRDSQEPMSILVERASDLEAFEFEVAPEVRVVVERFWPGPLTLVLPCRWRFGPGIARADGAVGVRCSAHPLAAAIARRLRMEGVGPITATSLNRSGVPPARTRGEAVSACGDDRDAPRIVGVEMAESGGEEASTVVDATELPLRVLRQGAVKASELEPWLRDPS